MALILSGPLRRLERAQKRSSDASVNFLSCATASDYHFLKRALPLKLKFKGLGLEGTFTWKTLMQIVYTLLTTNDLIQIDFCHTNAKERLKLIGQKLVR